MKVALLLLLMTVYGYFKPYPSLPHLSHNYMRTLKKEEEHSIFKDDLNRTVTPEQMQKLRPGRIIFKEDIYISDYIQILDGDAQYASLYFLLVESRSNKALNDPLVIWLNGGPGCSSMLGAYTELGPYKYAYNGTGNSTDDIFKMVYNKYAWNNNANVMFVD